MTVVAAVDHRARALEVLEAEERDAWRDYLVNTRDLPDLRYEEIEPWAWSRLQQRLRAIDARRSRLR